MKDVKVLGTKFGSAKSELLSLEKVASLPLLFSVHCESRQMEMDIDSCKTISVEKHPFQDSWDLTSKSNRLEADLKTLR